MACFDGPKLPASIRETKPFEPGADLVNSIDGFVNRFTFLIPEKLFSKLYHNGT